LRARHHGGGIPPDLHTDPAQLIVRKGFRPEIDSYSAFFENDHTTPTGLEGYLRSRGVTAVTLVGLATDYCVAYSALDAARLGFKATVLEGACRAIDLNGSLAEARNKMQRGSQADMRRPQCLPRHPGLPAFPSLKQGLETQAPALCIDDSLYDVQGFFEPKTNRIVLRAGLDQDMQLAILLHELRHLEQYGRGACPTIAFTLSDYMRLRLALEADAAAVGVYAAWKLQQSGLPGPLEQLQSWPTHDDIVTRFKAEIEATGDEVAATSAAFAQWFESDDRRGIYAFAICSNYLDALDTGKMPPGKQTVADDIATRLCVLPDGQAYGCSLPP
jgi:hypothetical protein